MGKELTSLEKIHKKHKDMILTLNTVLIIILLMVSGGTQLGFGELFMGILLTTLLISIPIQYIFILLYNIIKSFWEDIGDDEKTKKGYKISFGITLIVMLSIYFFLYFVDVTIKL